MQSSESGVRLRRLAASDLERVVAIDAAAAGRSRRAYFERRLAAALRDPAYHVQFAAEGASGLAGFVLARVLAGEFGHEQPALALEVIGVDPAYQGQRAGARLLDALESEARQRGVRELWTQVSWRQDRMLRFLARSGFALASPQVLECPVHGGAYGVGAEAPARPADQERHEIDYSAPAANDYEKLARDVREVRSMVPGDLEAIARIDRKLTGRERRGYIERRLEEALGQSAIRVSLVARCEDALAGYAMARIDFGDFGRVEPAAVLDTIGVDPDYARRGVGAALLSQLFVNLAALGIEWVETRVARDDFELLGFLYRAGFCRSPRLAFAKRLEG
jgi:ribosomal protein S18 acetylase RimI-like enzyme